MEVGSKKSSGYYPHSKSPHNAYRPVCPGIFRFRGTGFHLSFRHGYFAFDGFCGNIAVFGFVNFSLQENSFHCGASPGSGVGKGGKQGNTYFFFTSGIPRAGGLLENCLINAGGKDLSRSCETYFNNPVFFRDSSSITDSPGGVMRERGKSGSFSGGIVGFQLSLFL